MKVPLTRACSVRLERWPVTKPCYVRLERLKEGQISPELKVESGSGQPMEGVGEAEESGSGSEQPVEGDGESEQAMEGDGEEWKIEVKEENRWSLYLSSSSSDEEGAETKC